MIPVELIPHDHSDRLNQVVDQAWHIFQSHFIYKRHPILKEAPFQHHFANILSALGSLYCVERSDIFFVDLETRCEGVKGKSKYVDITCSFPNANVSCAIELKFKTAQQGAQDHGRIDAYVDIEAVELVCDSQFTLGRFFMITDSSVYVNPSQRGVGTVFCMHDGFQVTPGQEIACPQSKGRETVVVQLKNAHVFEWQQHGGWYFLEICVGD
ncbi:hypothetical protein LOC68_05535 [Blastopirellula sp. JC732]|uniref:Uncharacterized protein n=1 Tax=Blastopirellula sediminis TaxID=2894196 RepID=A0A9X1SEG9_9BACT|nr:hypothetical protein [Blastopirellula sediminis]MCC9609373.1 hypothetical protein [Blastopirellula sediminis]MCC9627850.1 hypothetical protein [Blastopirellula sediminis]